MSFRLVKVYFKYVLKTSCSGLAAPVHRDINMQTSIFGFSPCVANILTLQLKHCWRLITEEALEELFISKTAQVFRFRLTIRRKHVMKNTSNSLETGGQKSKKDNYEADT